MWLTDGEGNRILDGMAGLWCTAVGYGRDSIVDAVAAQMRELPFYNTFFQSTHPPVAALSERLATLTPAQFNRFFYCSSGSEAIDTVIRARLLLFWRCGEKPGGRTIVIDSRRGGLSCLHRLGARLSASAVPIRTYDALRQAGPAPWANIFISCRRTGLVERRSDDGRTLSPEGRSVRKALRGSP